MTEQKKEPVSLATLMTPSRTVEIEYPGYEGLTFSLTYLAREELLKLRKKCVTTKFDKKTRQPVEELNDDKFLIEYTKAIVKGWSGLKYKYLEELLLVDVSSLDPEDTLQYTQENAELLMKNASEFDAWITETVGDLANFTKTK
jgi:hypothetical protein|tara:strand:+ start:4580 stop:5011 length:432 start_codon:yes stop_codon:yes gene_type:complete